VHEYASGLTSTPKAELCCSCKRRKFIGQNKVKIYEVESQNFNFLGQKIGCPSHNSPNCSVIHPSYRDPIV